MVIMMTDKTLDSLSKRMSIVIKNQVALDDKFSEMCIDISEALGTISNAMQSMSGNPVPKEEEEESHESGTITYL